MVRACADSASHCVAGISPFRSIHPPPLASSKTSAGTCCTKTRRSSWRKANGTCRSTASALLPPDNRCGIYDNRPAICRGYTTHRCDWHADAYAYDHMFTEPDQIQAFAKKYLKEKRRKRLRRSVAATLKADDEPQGPTGSGQVDTEGVDLAAAAQDGMSRPRGRSCRLREMRCDPIGLGPRVSLAGRGADDGFPGTKGGVCDFYPAEMAVLNWVMTCWALAPPRTVRGIRRPHL